MNKPTMVYCITDGEYVKVGISHDVDKRMTALQDANPRTIEFLWQIDCYLPRTVEQYLHRHLKRARRHVRGEWFDITEKQAMTLFRLAQSEVDSIEIEIETERAAVHRLRDLERKHGYPLPAGVL